MKQHQSNNQRLTNNAMGDANKPHEQLGEPHRTERQRSPTRRSTITLAAAAAMTLWCACSMGHVDAFATQNSLATTRTIYRDQSSMVAMRRSTQNHSRRSAADRSATNTPTCLHALQMSSSSGGDSSRCNELEFEMHVGKALDTLKKDYVELLVRPPDYSLYCKDIELVDPSGVSVHGIRSYQNAYRLLHTLLNFLYCPTKSAMTGVRMFYDPTKKQIKIHWNAEVVPREIFGGTRSILYVDGISVYSLDRASGDIYQHKFEQLVMNNKAVQPEEGVVEALRQYHGVTMPNCIQTSPPLMQQPSPSQRDLFTIPFQSGIGGRPHESLFSSSNSNNSKGSASSSSLHSFEASSEGGGNGGGSEVEINWEALESKNKSRKKFGLNPLTPEEFLRLESHVKAMDAEQQLKRQQQQAAAAAAEEQAQQRKQGGGMFQNLFGNVLNDTCESNFDCERPEVCCDFGFKKMCCSSGSPVLGQMQRAVVPVPVGTEDFPQNRPPSRY